jgi:hypothetical protein
VQGDDVTRDVHDVGATSDGQHVLPVSLVAADNGGSHTIRSYGLEQPQRVERDPLAGPVPLLERPGA